MEVSKSTYGGCEVEGVEGSQFACGWVGFGGAHARPLLGSYRKYGNMKQKRFGVCRSFSTDTFKMGGDKNSEGILTLTAD